MSNPVTKLNVVKAQQPKKQPSINRSHQRRMRRQALSGVGIGLVAITLTALSLSHLAHGIIIVTSSPAWEAWSMASGIDLGFIALELSQLMASNEKIAKHIGRFTRPAIVGTLLGSAAMNAFAFAAQANDYMVYPAVILGIAIPALIYALTRVGAALYIDCNK